MPRPTHPYCPTWAGFLFLAIVLDACSRKVVGWAMENHLRTELVLAAINMALAQRRPEGVIHHSDHGCLESAAWTYGLITAAVVAVGLTDYLVRRTPASGSNDGSLDKEKWTR